MATIIDHWILIPPLDEDIMGQVNGALHWSPWIIIMKDQEVRRDGHVISMWCWLGQNMAPHERTYHLIHLLTWSVPPLIWYGPLDDTLSWKDVWMGCIPWRCIPTPIINRLALHGFHHSNSTPLLSSFFLTLVSFFLALLLVCPKPRQGGLL